MHDPVTNGLVPFSILHLRVIGDSKTMKYWHRMHHTMAATCGSKLKKVKGPLYC